MSFINFVERESNRFSMVGHSDCCYIMNDRVDISDIKVGSRIRVGDNDIATVKYIGEVRIYQCDEKCFCRLPIF